MTEQDNDHDLLIALNSKVDTILLRYTEIEKVEARVRELEIIGGGYKENLSTIKSEIEKLRNINTIWSTLNTLGGIILAVIIGKS